MKKRLWLASAVAFLGFQGAAEAQQGAQPAAPRVAETEETVVITAEKRAQDIQDVPVAVTAFTEKMRDQLAISTVQDLTNYTPGVAYQTSLDRFYIRGIGRSTNNLASDGGTAIYSDGVYTSSSYSAATPSIFIDRTEILRGPQGTLYGRNAIGGAINVISKRPSAYWTKEVRGTVGSFDRYEAGGRFSGPLSDQIRIGLTGNYIEQGEGYSDNASGRKTQGQNGYSTLLEGAIEADLTDDLSFYLRARSSIYDYSPRSGSSNTPYQLGVNYVPSGSLGPGAQTALAPGSGALNLVFNGTPVTVNPSASDVRRFSNDTWNHQTIKDTYDIASEVSWDIGDVNVKYITGAVRYNYEQIADFDGTNLASFTIPVASNPTCASPPPAVQCATVSGVSESHYIEDKRWWSHELNFSSNNDAPLQWLTGLYYYKEFFDQPLFFPTSGIAHTAISQPSFCWDPTTGCTVTQTTAIPALLLSAQLPNPSGNIYHTETLAESESYAGFGQLDWSFTPKWKATFGLRYTHDKKEALEQFRSICYGLDAYSAFLVYSPFYAGVCPALTTAGAGATAYDITGGSSALDPGVLTPVTRNLQTGFAERRLGDTWQATTGTLGIQWDPTEDTMMYARYSRGYKAGAFNAGSAVPFPEADPEHVNAYELGLKTTLANLQANVSAFYYDYQDRQTPVTVPADGVVYITQTSIFENVPKSVSQGVEVESIWTPFTDAHINLNYAYLDAHVEDSGPGYIDGFNPTITTAQNLSGAQLPLSPKHRVTIHGDYTMRFDAGSLYLGASYIWRDEQYGSFFNQPYYFIPSSGQTDLQAVWRSNGGNWQLLGNVKNLFDEEIADAVYPSLKVGTNVYKTTSLAPPRTISLELRAKF